MADRPDRQRRSRSGRTRRRRRSRPPPPADPEVPLAGSRRRVLGTPRQAARRPGQSHRPREIHLRHQSPRHALRPDRPLAASARADRVDRSVRGAESAGREGGDRVARSGERRAQHGDVPGRRSRGGRGRHRRARDRRRAAGQGASTKSCRTSPSSIRRSPATRPPCSTAATCDAGHGAGDRRSRRRLQAGRARRRRDLLDARHHARVPRVARRRLRVGRRQADGVGVDAGRSAPRARASPAA